MTNTGLLWALYGGGMAAAATAAGALPVLFSKALSTRSQDTLLGFGAGVMLAATCFSLILPGLESARELYVANKWIAAGIVSLGLFGGVFLIRILERFLPHEHFVKGSDRTPLDASRSSPRARNRLWLFVAAIVIHNFPEGLAIGVAAGSEGAGSLPLSVGISFQDIPEGLVVALALLELGYSRWTAFLAAGLSGLAEPAAALFGAALVGLSQTLLAWGLALAAGAMLFVISHEVIPECHRRGNEMHATWGLVAGFAVMMILDYSLSAG